MTKLAWPYSTAEGRWAGFGPYYAMFPVGFAKRIVETMCPLDGGVLDPFCGRGTAPFVAQATGRFALGLDINPVAWVFAIVKTHPEPNAERVIHRLDDVRRASRVRDAKHSNEFQRWAWSSDVLRFLKTARRVLDWENDKVDRTLMGFVLTHVHAKIGDGISNQMHKSRALGPDYAVRWWKERNMPPPDINPIIFLRNRILWRYCHGVVRNRAPEIILERAEKVLPRRRIARFDLLLTSPPYFNVTDYRQDSWIRLWMLKKGPALPNWKSDLKFARRSAYQPMLENVFSSAVHLMKPGCAIWVRTSARKFTREATIAAIHASWPRRKLYLRLDFPKTPTQTAQFGHTSSKPTEMDLLIARQGMPPPRGFTPFRLD